MTRRICQSANAAHFINTSAFSITPQFELGNASRDPARGRAYRDLDLALVKSTVTHTPAFAQRAATVGAAGFGSITATASDPRVAQGAAKLHL